MNKVYKSLNK